MWHALNKLEKDEEYKNIKKKFNKDETTTNVQQRDM
jgi:hypothetical protein